MLNLKSEVNLVVIHDDFFGAKLDVFRVLLLYTRAQAKDHTSRFRPFKRVYSHSRPVDAQGSPNLMRVPSISFLVSL